MSTRRWGNWKLLSNGVLRLQTNTSREIDIERCFDSAEILDWIFHFQGRLSDQDLADMVRALGDILEPCANYCSWGKSKTADPTSLFKTYWKASGPKR